MSTEVLIRVKENNDQNVIIIDCVSLGKSSDLPFTCNHYSFFILLDHVNTSDTDISVPDKSEKKNTCLGKAISVICV